MAAEHRKLDIIHPIALSGALLICQLTQPLRSQMNQLSHIPSPLPVQNAGTERVRRPVLRVPSDFSSDIYISNGDGFDLAAIQCAQQDTEALKWLTGDINGDGRTALMQFRLGRQVSPGLRRVGVTIRSWDGSKLAITWKTDDLSTGLSPQAAGALTINTLTNPGRLEPTTFLAGDINGDGKTDLILLWKTFRMFGVQTTADRNKPFSLPSQRGLVSAEERLAAIIFTSDGRRMVPSAVSYDLGQKPDALAFLTGDINGDGKTDLIQISETQSNPGTFGVRIYLSDGHTLRWTSTTDDISKGTMIEGCTNQAMRNRVALLIGDINGDGKSDLIVPWRNGDRLGMLFIASDGRQLIPNSCEADVGPWFKTHTWLTGDLNGDQRTDLVEAWEVNPTSLGISTFISNGSKLVPRYSTAGLMCCGGLFAMSSQSQGTLTWLAGDINGDRKTDIISVSDTERMTPPPRSQWDLVVTTYIASGSILAPLGGLRAHEWEPEHNNLAFFVGDLNGDGRADLINVKRRQPVSHCAEPPAHVASMPSIYGGASDPERPNSTPSEAGQEAGTFSCSGKLWINGQDCTQQLGTDTKCYKYNGATWCPAIYSGCSCTCTLGRCPNQ